MPVLEHYVGEVLDDKYRLEHLLGHGGMGAVYLATHLGTERYVALKLISPQFMRNNEFVERFKREARAAGRLRHPNVVDVTDFGFASLKAGQVAYLVMEYLDGCTLGDVLSEEKRLPLEWVADILDQVCSAVHEAHQQGIIHRDLKPDNIWLEPNRLGSYRVKVLDFGIAKLGEARAPSLDDDPAATIIDDSPVPSISSAHLETDTLLRSAGDEAHTQAFKIKADGEGIGTVLQNPLTDPFINRPDHLADDDGTLLFDQDTRGGRHTAYVTTLAEGSMLTRVGAIMGTPLYMSPEQCGGGYVDTRSDIYSLGVIAYQMLAGEPPFAGNTSTVMRAHREETPQHLRERAAKIPKRAASVVMSALSKNPAERPQTAFAFGSALRGQSEGVGALYRRAFSLYSEYFPKFVKLSFIAHLPVIVTSILITGLFIADKYLPKGGLPQKIAMISALVIVALLQIVAYMVAGGVISGVTAVIITQLTAAPLRPVKLRVAFGVLRKRWRAFLKTMILVTLRILLGCLLLIVPGIITWIRYSLYAPVVLIEGLEKKAAMRRARELASRSWRTIVVVSILQIIIPMTISVLVGRVKIGINTDRDTLGHRIYQQVLGLANIFVVPLISIVPALLYIKMRQLGGEPLSAAFAQIEEGEGHQSAWQQRMRTRLTLHTPISQKNTTAG
jgi:serine/threonine protein kinase